MGAECCKLDDGVDDPENPRNVTRFFMVGTGGAGKTTVVRMLKCLCKELPKDYKTYNPNWEIIEPENIFSKIELNQFKRRIKSNILKSVYNLIKQSHDWELPISVPESANRVEEAKEDADIGIQQGATDVDVDSSLAKDILRVLDDEAIKKVLSKCHQMDIEYRLEDGTLHFLNETHIARIFDKDTEPTCEDIVHSRYPTTDIEDFRFGIKRMKLQIHDMGGQASELIILGMPDVHECGVMIFFNKQDRFDFVCKELLKTEDGRKEIIKRLGEVLDKNQKDKILKGTIDLKQLHDAICDIFIKKAIKPKRKGEGTKSAYMRCTQATDRQVMKIIFDAMEADAVSTAITNMV